MPLVATMSETRVLLRGVRWETYERLLEDLEHGGTRLTYDRGDLEIVSPSRPHERWKKLLGRMIEAMTEELDVPINSSGSMTFKRRDLEKGIEPDECYWVQNEAVVRGKTEIDLRVDPPPDLMVESEMSRPILDRLGILSAMGFPELWRFDGERLTILLRTESGEYAESPTSRCFPWLPLAPFAAWLPRAEQMGETTWIRAFRAWVKESCSPPSR